MPQKLFSLLDHSRSDLRNLRSALGYLSFFLFLIASYKLADAVNSSGWGPVWHLSIAALALAFAIRTFLDYRAAKKRDGGGQ